MIDHIGLPVHDYPAAKAFYTAALAPLGSKVHCAFNDDNGEEVCCGFGGEQPKFWIYKTHKPNVLTHVAFACDKRADVDAFHAAAIKAGAKDNGAPGLREHYHPSYYGAFVIDGDGHNIEAVCHCPQG